MGYITEKRSKVTEQQTCIVKHLRCKADHVACVENNLYLFSESSWYFLYCHTLKY